VQAAGAGIASTAKALKAQTAAVAIVGLPDLSDADKVGDSIMCWNPTTCTLAVLASPLHLILAVQTDNVTPDAWLQAAAAGKLAAGVMTGAYEATRFKAKPTVSELQSLAVLTPGDAQAAEAAITTAAGMAAGTMLTRWGTAAPA
jgi:hypothetical protein